MGKATPPTDQRRLVALWRSSTLSAAAFARAHGVLPVTFYSWVARHDPEPMAPQSMASFVQVTTVPVAAPIFVVHVDERTLRFDSPPPPAWFAAVLRELAPC